ncbi:MAG TPA: DUF2098 domain-containing protein, partial [Methanomicrobiales archaeon]|nr:DUF2098 domain-containing protein [Methanomicrobiales archaeon]
MAPASRMRGSISAMVSAGSLARCAPRKNFFAPSPISTCMMGEKGGYPFIGGERDDPLMQAGEVAVGMHVRYPRTGTTGKVVRIEKLDRDTFAEIDSTHLLYRTDQLIPF